MERLWIERALRAQYAGSHNAGSLLYMDVPSQDQAPIITPIPANGNDAYYEIMHKIMEQKILTGHRITSPMILGINIRAPEVIDHGESTEETGSDQSNT